jgi:hypothetical protein
MMRLITVANTVCCVWFGHKHGIHAVMLEGAQLQTNTVVIVKGYSVLDLDGLEVRLADMLCTHGTFGCRFVAVQDVAKNTRIAAHAFTQ